MQDRGVGVGTNLKSAPLSSPGSSPPVSGQRSSLSPLPHLPGVWPRGHSGEPHKQAPAPRVHSLVGRWMLKENCQLNYVVSGIRGRKL